MVLFVGIGVILCLTFLAGFAIHKYVDSSAISDGGAVETVTITVGGSTIKQTVSATSAKEPTAKEPTSKPASSATATSSAEESEETESSSGGFGGSEVFPGLSKNGIGVGMLPDYQDQTLVQINEGLGFKSSFHGW